MAPGTILIMLVAAAGLYAFCRSIVIGSLGYSSSIENESLKAFEAELQKFIGKDLKVYTNEHPYVWVENSVHEAREKIKNSCPKSRYGTAAALAKYQLRTSEKDNHIFLALNKKSTDPWPDLKLYEEWLNSNRSVVENIAKYKEAQQKNA